MAGVYISYPFCSQKCTYCNFASGVFPRELERRYLRALARELSGATWAWTPKTVYFGGGTPSLMDASALSDLLALIPKWQDRDLVRGQVWVDAETYNIPRIEGDATKSPSWWVLDLHILMAYGEVDGMWVRTFTHAVANVRFKGKYVMESRDLEYRFTRQTASRSRRNPAILAGSAITP